ncbi:hypothetical protein ACQEVC_41925 [Plantactinospora sp. CA-294935]
MSNDPADEVQRVAGRLSGDEADNLPFFYPGFAQRARGSAEGEAVRYV